VNAQGVLWIGLLALLGLPSWKGIDDIHQGFNRWTWTSLGLVGLTLAVTETGMAPHTSGLTLAFTGKFFGVVLSIIALGWLIKTQLTGDETRDFFLESWKFVKQIFPLLVVGAFAVGMVRELIRRSRSKLWLE
jgi:uncharacterized protein